MFDNPVSA